MKRTAIIIVLFLFAVNVSGQTKQSIDSTVIFCKAWLDIISNENFKTNACMHGITRERYDTELKLLTQSLENYEKGKFRFAYEDSKDVRKLEQFMEAKRIKYFLMTMSQIKLNGRYKARKWYYYSKKKLNKLSFSYLDKNVGYQKLPYPIENFTKVRGARTVVAAVGGGAFFIFLLVGSVLAE